MPGVTPAVRRFFPPLLIAIAVFAVFQPALRGQFTLWDDADNITEDSSVYRASFDGLLDLWRRPRMHLYVPVTFTAWWKLSLLSKATSPDGLPDPRLFHLANLLLHATASILVWVNLRKLLENRPSCQIAATIGALLFALHPLQAEAVGWISGLKDLLFAALCLATIRSHLWKMEAEGQSRFRRSMLTLGLLLLAMLSKPSAMTLPLIIAAIDLFWLRRSPGVVARSVVPMILLILPFTVFAKIVQNVPAASDDVPLYFRPILAVDSLAFYGRKLFWPANLTINYGRSPRWVMDNASLVVSVIEVDLVLLGAWLLRKKLPSLHVGIRIFILALLPVLGFVKFEFQIYSGVADHYLYLSMFGIALIAADLCARFRIAAIVLAVAILPLAFCSHQQIQIWRDGETLFSHNLKVNPDSVPALVNLSSVAIEKQDFPRAKMLSDRAISLRSFNPMAHANLASLALQRDDFAEAVREFEISIEQDPNNAKLRVNLGTAYGAAGRIDDAIRQYQTALRIEPTLSKAQEMLRKAAGYRAATRATSRPVIR